LEDLRMNRMIVTALLGAAAALSMGATAAEAAQANACFYSRDITNWKNVGDKVVNLEINSRDVYRLDLAVPCTQLHFAHQSLILDARGGSGGGPVCASSLADIIVPGQGAFRCPVATITKLSKEEAKALPKKERP
jgi:hypothetical protein